MSEHGKATTTDDEDAYQAAAAHLRDACFFHTQCTRNMADDCSFWESMATIPSEHHQLNRQDASSALLVRPFPAGVMCSERAHLRMTVCGQEEPVVLLGLADLWPAKQRWLLSALLDRHGQTSFLVPGAGKVRLDHFVRFVSTEPAADWPYYVFEDELCSDITADYTIPTMFEDLLRVPAQDRPSPRYMLIGARGTGSLIHTDPMQTAAWNTLFEGRKRWCVFPPTVPAAAVNPTGVVGESLVAEDELVQYVVDLNLNPALLDWGKLDEVIRVMYRGADRKVTGVHLSDVKCIDYPVDAPTLQLVLTADQRFIVDELSDRIQLQSDVCEMVSSVGVKHQCTVPSYPIEPTPLRTPSYWFQDIYPRVKHTAGMREYIQLPGETVVVPRGWHHVVLNLDWTVAMTHNYIPRRSFPGAFKALELEDQRFAQRWHAMLSRKLPSLARLVVLEEPLRDAANFVDWDECYDGWRHNLEGYDPNS